MKKPIDLENLIIPNSKLHVKPHQLVIKDKKGTLIFFRNGSFRVMGCIDVLDASFLAFSYISRIDCDDVPKIYSQSYTSAATLGYNGNMYKLAKCDKTFYKPELFAAVCMTKYNSVFINVFSTGSVVACGLKEPEDFYIILKEIDSLCKLINV